MTWLMEAAVAYWNWIYATVLPWTGEPAIADWRKTPVAVIATIATFVGTLMIVCQAIGFGVDRACSAVRRAWQSWRARA